MTPRSSVRHPPGFTPCRLGFPPSAVTPTVSVGRQGLSRSKSSLFLARSETGIDGASDGVLVFKWNETQVKLREVLALTPHAPLFGNTSGKKAGTHWLVFMKPAGGSE